MLIRKHKHVATPCTPNDKHAYKSNAFYKSIHPAYTHACIIPLSIPVY